MANRSYALLEYVPDAVLIVDGEGRIVQAYGRAQVLFGYPSSELVGRDVEVLAPERLRQEYARYRRSYLASPKTRVMGSGIEIPGRREDGAEVPLELTLWPLLADEGLVIVIAARDISERKRSDLALELAYRDLEAFSDSLAHDLRTPLRAISGFAQVLLSQHAHELDRRGMQLAREIQLNAGRMADRIEALLSLAHITQAELVPEIVDLAEATRTVARELAWEPSSRAVEWVVPDRLEAWMHARLAHTLMDSLVGNAWKFTSQAAAARIEVGAIEEGGGPTYYVRDNGVGFDMTQATRLFAPFQRLHPVGDFPGAGVGLATAQRIVHRHGGRIWAEGTVGAGATFYFTLARRPAP